ncbi:MAG: hypothetical protein MZV70_17765 [Desulfobacterales bacterium]|nr:hypothetical protein [Desulfobacterales bacterium]
MKWMLSTAPAAEDDTVAWLKSLDEPEEEPINARSPVPQAIYPPGCRTSGECPAAEIQPSRRSEAEVSEWKSAVEEPVAESAAPEQESAPEELPAWLHGHRRGGTASRRIPCL